jgi:hypothetical protein
LKDLTGTLAKNTAHFMQSFAHAAHILGESEALKLLLLAAEIPGALGAGGPANPNLNLIFAILH